MFDYSKPRIQPEFMVGDRMSPDPEGRKYLKVFDVRSTNEPGWDTECRRRLRYGVDNALILEDFSLAVHQQYVDDYGPIRIGDPPIRTGGGLSLPRNRPCVVAGYDESVIAVVLPRLVNGPSLANLTEASFSYAKVEARAIPKSYRGRAVPSRHSTDIKRYDMGIWLSKHLGFWHATGREVSDTFGPTRDTTGSSTNHQWGSRIQFIHAMQPLDHRVDYITWLARPDFYEGLRAARPLYRLNPAFTPFDQVWHSSYHGRALLVNQQSGEHIDTKGVRRAWDVLVAAGEFEGGEIYLVDSDIHIPFMPGDMVAFDGTSQRHEIRPFNGKLRISHVYFVHRSVLDELDVPMKLEDLYLCNLRERLARFVPNGPGGRPPPPYQSTPPVASPVLGK
ncbi:2OG-Fe(II) oxygenase family protein [Ceratobasidium sp. AG-Ba]|nr:2OG-Fe(II) oxygenase family protein [Ceratobasidium sp. AG-Ba]